MSDNGTAVITHNRAEPISFLELSRRTPADDGRVRVYSFSPRICRQHRTFTLGQPCAPTVVRRRHVSRVLPASPVLHPVALSPKTDDDVSSTALIQPWSLRPVRSVAIPRASRRTKTMTMAEVVPSMFGLLVSGRLVRTDFDRLEETKFMITINSAESVNYICVFLTGLMPFPEGTAGSVYFSWPDEQARPNWQLLGVLSNHKPSAIFKLSNLKQQFDTSTQPLNAFSQFPSISINAQIGISIEPIINVESLVINAEPSNNLSTFVEFTQKMVQNLFNYVSSYAVEGGPQQTPMVPLLSVQKWYENFERKLNLNPNFWKS